MEFDYIFELYFFVGYLMGMALVLSYTAFNKRLARREKEAKPC